MIILIFDHVDFQLLRRTLINHRHIFKRVFWKELFQRLRDIPKFRVRVFLLENGSTSWEKADRLLNAEGADILLSSSEQVRAGE